jgi:hypothetical protein
VLNQCAWLHACVLAHSSRVVSCMHLWIYYAIFFCWNTIVLIEWEYSTMLFFFSCSYLTLCYTIIQITFFWGIVATDAFIPFHFNIFFCWIQVPDDVLINRCVGRRLDPVTGKIYHLTNFPPENEEISARLITRSDDTFEKVPLMPT